MKINTKFIVRIRKPEPSLSSNNQSRDKPLHDQHLQTRNNNINNDNDNILSLRTHGNAYTTNSLSDNSSIMSYNQNQHDYTIFTTQEPTDKLITTQKPISGKFIKTNVTNEKDLEENISFLTKQYNSRIYSFDQVYNDRISLDTIYLEQVKNCINSMFLGKNTSIVLFGPENCGKSFLLKGEKNSSSDNESSSTCGVLGRSVQDIFNLIDVYSNTENLNRNFKLKVSIFLAGNDFLYDLLSNKNAFKQTGESKDNQLPEMPNLNKILILSKKEFDVCFLQALEMINILNRKKLITKNNFIVSLYLEDNRRIISQLDFIELSWESNPNNNNNNNYDNERNIEQNISGFSSGQNKEIENYISYDINTISSVLNNEKNNYNSTLKTVLINTLYNPNNNNANGLIFFLCVNSNENPPDASYKAISFSNWLQKGIKNKEINELNYNFQFNFSDNSKSKSMSNWNPVTNRNTNSNLSMKNQLHKDYIEDNLNDNFKENLRSSDNENEIEMENENYNKERKKINNRGNSENLSEGLQSEINMLKELKRKMKMNKNARNNTQSGEISSKSPFRTVTNSNNPEKLTINNLEKSMRQNEAKIDEIKQNMENMKNYNKEKSRIFSEEKYSQNAYDVYEIEALKNENTILKSDNMIYREDINQLAEVNRRLDDDLSVLRKRNFDTLNESEQLHKEILQKQLEVDKLTEAISKLKIFQNPELELALENRHAKDYKIKELEAEIKYIKDEKQKMEIEHRITLERFNDLKSKNEEITNELNFIRTKESDAVNTLEAKIEKLSNELDYISKENKVMRLIDEKCRNEINNANKLKDKYEFKYRKYKDENQILSQKNSELENNFRMLIVERNNDTISQKREEEAKKNKVEAKQKLLEDMQNRILNYKKDLKKQRNKSGD